MPGNEFGDRVHNFFAQDNASQGQHQSHVLEGNWPVLNNNFWVGSQRQIDVLSPSNKNFSLQNSEIDRGQPSYPVHAAHGLNFSQSNLRPDFSSSQSVSEQRCLNGYKYGNQFYQTEQNEGNFLAADADSDQRHLAPRGFLVHELPQGSGHEQQPKAPGRVETSVSPISFDLFGGQQQKSHQQASMLQDLQRQQSGVNDMQQLQQQLMIRKMQELQRQQQLQQLDLRPQKLINQVPPLTKQESGIESSLVNGTPNSDALRYPWTAEPDRNWLRQDPSTMQGSPSGIGFSPNLGQTQHLMDLVPQQVNHSLYGVPVSNSRGSALNQYPQMPAERYSMPQMATSSNSLHGNQHNLLPDRMGGLEGTLSISRQKFENENSEHASIQSGIMDMGFLQQVDSLQENSTRQDYAGRQDLTARSETLRERSMMQVSSPLNDVTLDPTEEKILYGSDDNIWAAFGKNPDISGEAANLFDTGGPSNGSTSIQCGIWSALMQSAVAETSSTDTGPQEEWSGLIFEDTHGSSNQPPSIHHGNVKQASLPNDIVRVPSALGSGSVPPSYTNTPNPFGLNQLGHNLQKEPSERVPTDTSQGFGHSLEEASKWRNQSPVKHSLSKGSQKHGNASQNSLNAERDSKTISATPPPGHSGTRPQPNGWNALAAFPPAGDRVLNIHEAEKKSRNSQNNQARLLQGEAVNGSTLYKSSSVTSSATELGHLRSLTGNHQENKGVSSFHDTMSSVANSCNTEVGDGAGPFVQNNYLLDPWKNASTSAKFQGGEDLGTMVNQVNEQSQGYGKDEVKRHDRKNCSMKENSHDSHGSNLSWHASGDFKESGLSDAGDSRVPAGKNKSNNQFAGKVSVPRKFQYHPMGNLDEDVEPIYSLKQPGQAQAGFLQNAHVGQLKLSVQVSRNSTEKDKLPKENKGPEREPSGGSFPGYAHSTSVPLNQPFDSCTNKVSSPSQNMLELLHKVDQSRDHGSLMQLSSSGGNVSSQLPEAEKNDGSAGRLQPSQSSSAQGFGLQLGLPSQLLQIHDLSSPSQNAQGTFYSTHTSHAGTEMGEAGLLMVATSAAQSLSFPNEKSHVEYKNDSFSGPGHPASSQVLHNTWTNVPTSQHTSAARYPKAPSNFSELSQSNIVESNYQSDLDISKGAHISSKSSGVDGEEHRSKVSSGLLASFVNIGSAPKMEVPLGRTSSIKNHFDDSPANSASTHKDIEAYGRPLRPNVLSNENYALLNQMSALKDAENDPTIRFSKRIKGPDSTPDFQQLHLMPGKQNENNVGDTLCSSSGVPSEDSRIPSFSAPSASLLRNTSPHGNAAPEDFVVGGMHDSQSNPSTDCSSVRAEHHAVSPQMAPSWFNNGQMLPVHNARKVTFFRQEESPFTLGKSSSVGDAPNLEDKNTAASVDTSRIGSTLWNSAPSSEANEHLSSPQSLQLNVGVQHQVILRPKKRKSATSELQPWYKELLDGSHSLSILSTAETNWNMAVNRITEKVEDDVGLTEDGHPILRSKRRLILTTQLAQKLFCPPPATILSSDASSTYESVAYAVSRVALGDACSALSSSSNLGLPAVMGKLKGDPRFAKVIEDLLGKSRKLENDFMRLDKNASLLDLRLESQDLEKFAVINRFAKFHGRGQTDNAEISSTDATATTHKPCAQRYVSAVPMPRSLPERVQCLSL